jgi:hypothetical protein
VTHAFSFLNVWMLVTAHHNRLMWQQHAEAGCTAYTVKKNWAACAKEGGLVITFYISSFHPIPTVAAGSFRWSRNDCIVSKRRSFGRMHLTGRQIIINFCYPALKDDFKTTLHGESNFVRYGSYTVSTHYIKYLSSKIYRRTNILSYINSSICKSVWTSVEA